MCSSRPRPFALLQQSQLFLGPGQALTSKLGINGEKAPSLFGQLESVT